MGWEALLAHNLKFWFYTVVVNQWSLKNSDVYFYGHYTANEEVVIVLWTLLRKSSEDI